MDRYVQKEKNVNKVYCCNCRYFVEGLLTKYSFCNAPTGRTVIDPVNGEKAETVGLLCSDKSYPNKFYNCNFYNLRRQKFWANLLIY